MVELDLTASKGTQQKKSAKKGEGAKADDAVVPLDLNPFASSRFLLSEEQQRAPSFQRQERELFEMAIILEGVV